MTDYEPLIIQSNKTVAMYFKSVGRLCYKRPGNWEIDVLRLSNQIAQCCMLTQAI